MPKCFSPWFIACAAVTAFLLAGPAAARTEEGKTVNEKILDILLEDRRSHLNEVLAFAGLALTFQGQLERAMSATAEAKGLIDKLGTVRAETREIADLVGDTLGGFEDCVEVVVLKQLGTAEEQNVSVDLPLLQDPQSLWSHLGWCRACRSSLRLPHWGNRSSS